MQFKRQIVSLDSLSIDLSNEEYASLNAMETNVIKGIVKNSDQFGYTTDYRLKALKILENRGIHQDELLQTNSLYNGDYLKLNYYYKLYQKQSGLALTFSLLSIVFAILSTSGNIILMVVGLVNLVLMYTTIHKSSESLQEIKAITDRDSFTNIYLAFFLGFPFFIFIYLYNKIQLKEAVAEFTE